MLVASGNTYEIAGTDAVLTGVVFVQISALDHDKPDIVCVSVHSGVESGLELGEGGVRLPVRVSPDWGHGRTFTNFSESRLIGGSKDHFARLSSLPLHPHPGPCQHERPCHSNTQQCSLPVILHAAGCSFPRHPKA